MHNVHVEFRIAGDDAAENEDQSQDAGDQCSVVDGARSEESDKTDDVEKEADNDGDGDHEGRLPSQGARVEG